MSVLSEASKAYAKNPCREEMDQMLVALMLGLESDVSVYLAGQVTGAEMNVQLGMVQASDGGWYGVMCTSQEELHKLPGAVSITMPLRQVLTSIRSTPGMAGLVVDPGNGANCFLKESEIGILLTELGNRTAAPGNSTAN